MTGTDLAATLTRRGLDPIHGHETATLFDRVLAASRRLTDEAPPHVWWVPGRLEVFGKHTDYAGGRTLVCAVPRGFAVAARPRGEDAIRVLDARRGGQISVRIAADVSFRGWRHYVEVCARRLSRNFPGAPLGADIVVASNLPPASGLSSSSALVVAIAAALARAARLPERPEWQANIHGPLDAAGYYACIENGLTFGTLAGDAGVGTHGGSEDHAAILTASPDTLSAFAFVPMRPLARVAMPGGWRFVVAPSGVRAVKTGAAQAPYNHLARGARMLLDLCRLDDPQAVSLGSALAPADTSSAHHVDRLRHRIRQSSMPGWTPDALERRLDHFIREDARVPAALTAFADDDAAALTTLAVASQADADALLQNQTPETIALAASARRLGAFAACSFGAGFGGSVWALAESHGAADLARRWQPGAFIAQPGPPLTELTPPEPSL